MRVHNYSPGSAASTPRVAGSQNGSLADQEREQQQIMDRAIVSFHELSDQQKGLKEQYHRLESTAGYAGLAAAGGVCLGLFWTPGFVLAGIGGLVAVSSLVGRDQALKGYHELGHHAAEEMRTMARAEENLKAIERQRAGSP